MILYAAGFNAWNQLCFGNNEIEPHDIYNITKVLEAQHIEPPVSRLSYTLVRHDGRLSMAGAGLSDDEAYEAVYAHAEAANGEILVAVHGTVKSSSADHEDVSQHHLVNSGVRAIAAYAAGFVILFDNGTVKTMGDARYQDCLGRQIDSDSPAEEPCVVPDLASLDEPVIHVSAGGYSLAALTKSGGLYLWGSRPSSAQARQHFLPELSSIPNYVQVDGYNDVRHVAIGDSHAIVLMADGTLRLIGDNSNGQLGVGDSTVKGLSSWTEVTLSLPDGYGVVAVAAGPRASFILAASISSHECSHGTRVTDIGGNVEEFDA